MSGSIYEFAGVAEGDLKALHSSGHTIWDCGRCGADPEDCYCEDLS